MFNDNPLSALEACGLRGWRYLFAWFHVVVAHIASAGIATMWGRTQLSTFRVYENGIWIASAQTLLASFETSKQAAASFAARTNGPSVGRLVPRCQPQGIRIFVKRGLTLDPPLIAGIVVVLLLLNIMLAVAFCALRNRRKRKDTRITHKRRISAPVDCEKYESSVAFAITTGAIPAGIPTGHKASVVQGAGRKSYLELIQALQRQPEAPSPTRLSRGSSRSSADNTRRLSTYVLRPQDIRELDGVSRYPKAKGRVQVLRQSALLMPPGRGGLTRSSSLTDTASVYSSASAPMEYHDQLFRAQPFALDPNPPASAPAWLPELPKPPAPVMTSNGPDSVEKVKTTPHSPPHTPSERQQPLAAPDVSPSPSVPSASTASLRSPTRYRSRANSNPQRPQVTWLPPKEWDSPPPLPRPRKTSSVSSLSTIFSLHEATRVPLVPAMPVMPLNVKRSPKNTKLKDGTSPATPSSTSSKTVNATPSLPARSSRRPAASGSEERLP